MDEGVDKLSYAISQKLNAAIDKKIGKAVDKVAKSSRYTGQVTRVDNQGQVWAVVPGYDGEIPISSCSVDVSKGDNVPVVIENYQARIDGNYSQPPIGTQKATVVVNNVVEPLKETVEASQHAIEAIQRDVEIVDERTATAITQIEEDVQTVSTATTAAIEQVETDISELDSSMSSFRTTTNAAISQINTDLATTSTAASTALTNANLAGQAASQAQAAAEAAQGDIDEQQEYFWHDRLGAHVLSDTDEVSGKRFRQDMKGNSTEFFELDETTGAQTSVAMFGGDGARIGKNETSQLRMLTDKLVITDENAVAIFDVSATAGTRTEAIVMSFSSRNIQDMVLDGNEQVIDEQILYLPSLNDGDSIDSTGMSITLMCEDSESGSYCTPIGAFTEGGVSYSKIGSYTALLLAPSAISFAYGASRVRSFAATITFENSSGTDEYVYLAVQYDYDADNNTIARTIIMASQLPPSASFSRDDFSFTATFSEPAYTLGIREGDIGPFSAIIGYHLIASQAYQLIVGEYNVEDTGGNYAIIVGNGTADNARSNALTVDWNGNVECGTVNEIDISDTGWETLSLNSGWVAYSSDWTPRYRKKNGIVYLSGAVKPTTSKLIDGNGVDIATMPDGFRPAAPVNWVITASGVKICLLRVYPGGTVRLLQLRTTNSTSYQNASTSEFLQFTVCYPED